VESRGLRVALRIWVGLVLAFLFVPILIIIVYAFNSSNVQSWPIAGFSLKWFRVTWHDPQVRQALWLSVRVGLLATAVALVLGSMAAFGVHRFRFFGREAVSFLLVLPIALPGIVTGIALNSLFGFAGITLSIWTIVIGHATFCIVVVYNNVIARLRRTSGSLIEASMDLGAHGLQTFRWVTFPLLSTAVVSGALLAFALSFDEIVVTNFTAGAHNTLPIWIFGAIRNGQQLPEVNVVVFFVILLTGIRSSAGWRPNARMPGCSRDDRVHGLGEGHPAPFGRGGPAVQSRRSDPDRARRRRGPGGPHRRTVIGRRDGRDRGRRRHRLRRGGARGSGGHRGAARPRGAQAARFAVERSRRTLMPVATPPGGPITIRQVG
jgi:putative spermidine/putrescine transport system permease protein